MRAVCQRVRRAEVRVDGEVRGRIRHGLCVLVGVARGDGEAEATRLAAKLARLRVFADDGGRFDRSLLDVGGAALVVSQFTLLGDTSRGHRPSFGDAATGDEAKPLYDAFCRALEGEGVRVATGVFGARMILELENDGPVTVTLAT